MMITSAQNPSSLRNAIYWWQGRLIHATHQKAELLRNGLLQDIFALRRSLEFSYCASEPWTLDQLQSGIEQLTHVHERMAALSDELAPPQFDDLASALRQLLLRWQEQSSQGGHCVSYPEEWDEIVGDSTLNEVVVLILTEWLHIVGTVAPVNLEVSLRKVNRNVELILQASLSEMSPLLSSSAIKELNYLEQIFCQLTQGQYLQSLPQPSQARSIKGIFSWRSNALADTHESHS